MLYTEHHQQTNGGNVQVTNGGTVAATALMGLNNGGGGNTAMIARECANCGKRITERFLLKALDLFWHEDCLKCGCCDCRLGEVGSTLYTKANLILCKRDYLRYDRFIYDLKKKNPFFSIAYFSSVCSASFPRV